MVEDPIIELFSGSLWEAELLKTLLNDNDIDCFIKNSIINSFVYEPTYSAGVKIMILKSNLEKATRIVNEYWKNIKDNDR
jgi:hypothetical protein